MPKPTLPRKNFKWTSELAYAVGLITTDGCLSPDRRHLTLTSCDKQLIKTFRRCLHISNKISPNPKGGYSNKTEAFRVQFGNVVLYDRLIKIGLHNNKSLTLGELNIKNQYFRDFLRGHLDGDGTIIQYIDQYNTPLNPKYVYQRLFVYFISASQKHILWLREKILDLTKLHGSLEIKQSKNSPNPLYRIKFSTKEAKVLLNWIYYKPNLPCLRRKYKIAKPFLNITPHP